MELLSNYLFWLTIVGAGCLLAERIAPWRNRQRLLRSELPQDLFWFGFNGYVTVLFFGGALAGLEGEIRSAFGTVAGLDPESIRLLAEIGPVLQFAIVLVLADLIEWCIHNALHRVEWLWRFHRVHHSITEMDWIGNFRFHFLETIVYRAVRYLPLAILGARWDVILSVAVFATAIGSLNHSNLRISWGPLRYVFNSPRMHIWHHDRARPGVGVNFGVVLSLWDWLFGTAYFPADHEQPGALGFRGQERTPSSLLSRFFVPFYSRRQT